MLYELLQSLVVLVAPVLTFSSEEVWQHMPKRAGLPFSVQLAAWPVAKPQYLNTELEAKWDKLLELRSEVTKALEISRRNKEIGNSLDADLLLYAEGEVMDLLRTVDAELANYFIVSAVNLANLDQAPETAVRSETLPLAVQVVPAVAEKCERCWIHAELTSPAPGEPGLCKRCAAVMTETGVV